ncbi:contact-dependent growth inhibition system immunity protein [Luteimicrobium sp. DT211]|uniref:contact-dependent growth inhibition system immunity protein n=1 Tax=Luteimicrobium sp. DT211 TaxID=3393412 RepID=UPI003CF36BAB
MTELEYLARAYFHPDWDVEARPPEAVLAAFVREEPPDDLVTLRRELTQVLAANPGEAELRDLWVRRSGASWDPGLASWGPVVRGSRRCCGPLVEQHVGLEVLRCRT